ncbi:hypothetical protein [Streptomyces sp. NPDC059010]|uniref:hypothetical protein n=1 Tax=Streptomyces sp. NPDC059010 TaxID=3346695 RepID=UPI00367DFF50
MKKISALAALTMAALVLAAPAHADGRDRGRINIAGYSTGDLCREALSVVPFAVPLTGPAVNDACYDRDHDDDTRDQAGVTSPRAASPGVASPGLSSPAVAAPIIATTGITP